MKITLLLVGKTKEPYVQRVLEDYQKRIGRYVPFDIREVSGGKASKKLSIKEFQDKEARELRRHIPNGARVVLLDERGRQQSSDKFARWLQKQMGSGLSRLVFVVGGAYGFSGDFYRQAHAVLSLSQMTMAHQVVRIVFAEQLYRAFTILNGEPYHHGG